MQCAPATLLVAALLLVAGCTDRPAPKVTPRPSCPLGMVHIGGGTFTNTNTGVMAEVQSFCLDHREVSSASYAECVKAKACDEPDLHVDEPETVKFACNWGAASRVEHPVNCIARASSEAYCRWAGKRLPTAAEWEWAARGRSKGSFYPWGDDPPSKQVCWSGLRARSHTCSGSGRTGDWTPDGVRDMAGNVSEWTSTPAHPVFGLGAYLVKGGAFLHRDPALLQLSAGHVEQRSQVWRLREIGFRCARAE